MLFIDKNVTFKPYYIYYMMLDLTSEIISLARVVCSSLTDKKTDVKRDDAFDKSPLTAVITVFAFNYEMSIVTYSR